MTVMATFVGRQSEPREVASLLERYPVVTLVGPGGIGKTRLATELSGAAGVRFGGGVLFTELAGTSDRDDVPSVVAQQHGFGSIDALRLSSAAARTLVVLDNCESALRQASEVAAALVGNGGSVSVLATSREPLQIYGERIYVVEPLEIPRDQLPASVREAASTQLFLERAEAAGARWPLTDENLVAIGRLVRRLDGVPLAIELAAGRSRMLSPPELVTHLDRQLDLLSGPGEGATARHSSLRGAIATSYEPLTEDQRALFRALSAFSAPFDLALAHGVAGQSEVELDTLDLLTRLVDRSLVDARPGDSGTMEYRLLDSIRAFGLEQLELAGEVAEVGERYVDTVLDFADRITAEALEAFSPDVLGRIRDRFVHLTHAIEHCIDHDETPDRAYRMYVPMYGPTGARSEVASLGLRMRDAWTASAPLQAEAFAVLATAIFLRGDSTAAAPIAVEAIEHPDGSPLAKMVGHRVLGFIAAQEGEPERAMEELQSAIDLAIPFSGAFARELQASWGAVTSDAARGREALEKLSTVVDVAGANDEMVTVLWASLATAGHRVRLGDLEGGRRAAGEALAISDATGFPWSVGAAHRMMASVLVLQDGFDAAAPHFRTALDHTLATGDIEGVVVTMRAAAGAASRCGRDELAEQLWAVLPAGRGRPIITSFFLGEEEELERRLGAPTVTPISGLVEEARRLLGPAHDEAGETTTGAAGGIPSGTVTFLFTDVEGSTALWAADEPAMSSSLALHDELVRQVIEDHDGYVFSTAGDSFAAAFGAASLAVAAALATQRALEAAVWPGPRLRVRMGLHLGEAELRDGDFFGSVVNTAARVGAGAHGGQVLVTDVVRAAASTEGHDLGEHSLAGIEFPIRVWQVGDGDFPPLRSTGGPAPAPTTGGPVLRFGDCEIDLGMRELRRAGERVHIEPQVYDLLVFLIERRGTVASKNDILDEVWGDRFVSESALTTRIKSARKATGDDGRTQSVIRTVHGHGYSFVADVESI